MCCGPTMDFFESDFRAQNFSSSPSLMRCGNGYFLIRFLDPNFFFYSTTSLIVADSVHIFGGSDLSTYNSYFFIW